MNEIRQLCTSSLSPTEHLDEILALFHACPPQYLLPSLSLIGQSISCMPIEELNIDIVNHQLFLVIRQWSERLLQSWLVNYMINGEEHRALFYMHQLFKLLSEWLSQQEHLLNDHEKQEIFQRVLTHLFIEKSFLKTMCQVIYHLITNESNEQHGSAVSQSTENEDQVSPDDIQLQTTSDDQVNQTDILDVLYRCVNSLVILFNHPILSSNAIVKDHLTTCLLDCLKFPIFIQLSVDFLRYTSLNEKIPIRSIFLLFTCLDYCTLSITTSTLTLIPPIQNILHIWCELPQNPAEDLSPLIIRLIRLIDRLASTYPETIVDANLCAFFVPNFEILCSTSGVIDDIISLLVTLSLTVNGKRHLRRLGYIQHILRTIKRPPHKLWYPLSLLLTQRDFYQSSFFKRLIHLLAQRTIKILQLLSNSHNDTSYDSTTSSSRDQIYLNALDWFSLLRTHFLSFTMIVDELITYTKKVNLISLIIDTILSIVQDDDDSLNLIEIMIELLWTFSFSTSTDIHDVLQKRLDLCRWLTTNLNTSTSSTYIASQAILSLIDSGNQSLNRTISNHGLSLTTNTTICIIYSDESYHDVCVTFRDRLQTEFQYSFELVLTTTCQSLDTLINSIDQSILCLFCASTRMKIDNLAHFVFQYISFQPYSIPILTIQIEQQCDLEGSWLEPLIIIDTHSILKEIRRLLHQTSDSNSPVLNQTNDQLSLDHSSQIPNQSYHYMSCPVLDWSSDDVNEWCNTTRGNFDTLKPLVKRLNGSALIHLAEILSMEPASMYFSLNDELRQRTGSTVPVTEYVSLQSELQSLCKQNQCHMNRPNIPDNTKDDDKLRKRSRLCTIL
ncbi:unnamed protein product [Adineta ricciae]|uniref:Uncharacterized protein n=1 Tax=Adineta ricciae TaxID=249248 RepID=A0A814B8N9_ADIRI|nr:unnamed protein product [Adineta ricciae]